MANSKANPVEIQKKLGGVEYPASKQDLIEHANKGVGKDDEAMEVLKSLPDKNYDSPVDVTTAIGDLNNKK